MPSKEAIQKAVDAAQARYKRRWPPTVNRVEEDIGRAHRRWDGADLALRRLEDTVSDRLYPMGKDAYPEENEVEEGSDDAWGPLKELANAREKAELNAAEAELEACVAELRVLDHALIEAKLAQQNAPPNSVRAASGGRASPR
jgi:hypothetical protein